MSDPHYRIVYGDDLWGCGGWIAAVMLGLIVTMWLVVQLGTG